MNTFYVGYLEYSIMVLDGSHCVVSMYDLENCFSADEAIVFRGTLDECLAKRDQMLEIYI